MADQDTSKPGQSEACDCSEAPRVHRTLIKWLGMDEEYTEVSILACNRCGQHWLHLLIELEGFTASGRWYEGAITAEQAEQVSAENGQAMLEGLSWYFYGGSYYNGRTGKTAGKIW